MRIVVSGMVAGDPHQGGATWAVLQYAYGLQRLGHEVTLVEQVEEPTPEIRAYFEQVTRGLDASLGGPAPRADVLLNASGMLRAGIERIPIRVYLDLDPAFNQLWHVHGVDVGLAGHTHYATVGQRVGRPECSIPTCGVEWIHTLPPVVLDRWPVAERVVHDALTTIGNWRSYGTLQHDGVRYGQKAHSVRKLAELPAATRERVVAAFAIHPDEHADLELLAAHGWGLIDPREAAGSPEAYAGFVRGSRAEIGIAKEGYVVSGSGWFSDRSACYLASGRPVIAQDTGFGESLPTGAGLFAFATLDEAVAAVDELRRDYGRHARAARAIAEEFLDSDRVLRRLLREVGAERPRGRRLHDAPAEELAAPLALPVVRARSRPSAYRSSHAITELDLELVGGETVELVVKDVSREALLERARAAKLEFLADPLREISVYRDVLAPASLGTSRFYGVHGSWLYLERVRGSELYQVGGLDGWAEAARWLRRFHTHFRDVEHPRLLRYDEAFLRLWPARAGVAPPAYAAAVERLVALPRTLVHGDFYASNILVSPERVCPVDWELAGVGPGVLDLAALTMGWPDPEREALAAAYADGGEPNVADLDAAALHLAVRWLGWSAAWAPPPEHSQDWRAEIDRLAARLTS